MTIRERAPETGPEVAAIGLLETGTGESVGSESLTVKEHNSLIQSIMIRKIDKYVGEN
jgi:hypothetical protein